MTQNVLKHGRLACEAGVVLALAYWGYKTTKSNQTNIRTFNLIEYRSIRSLTRLGLKDASSLCPGISAA